MIKEKYIVEHKGKEYKFTIKSEEPVWQLFAEEGVEVFLKLYAECGWVNPVYAIVTGGYGPKAIGVDPYNNYSLPFKFEEEEEEANDLL